jgi:hypothetical protein
MGNSVSAMYDELSIVVDGTWLGQTIFMTLGSIATRILKSRW